MKYYLLSTRKPGLNKENWNPEFPWQLTAWVIITFHTKLQDITAKGTHDTESDYRKEEAMQRK